MRKAEKKKEGEMSKVERERGGQRGGERGAVAAPVALTSLSTRLAGGAGASVTIFASLLKVVRQIMFKKKT